MRYDEKQIVEIAKKAILDINPDTFKHDRIERAFFREEKLARGSEKDSLHPCWIVVINTIFDNTDYLIISDLTGEALYYQNFNMRIAEYEKDENGNYRIKK